MPAHIFIPDKNSIDQLAVQLNAETWELREEYSTRRDSISIDKPLEGFKAKTKSVLHQWLFEAPAEAEIELNNGLIYSKQGILYENNCHLESNIIKEGWVLESLKNRCLLQSYKSARILIDLYDGKNT